MVRCLLCSTTADDAAVVCPACGGAVAPDPSLEADHTHGAGIDLGKAPTDAAAPGPFAPPPGAPGYPPPGPYAAPGFGPPGAPGPPGYPPAPYGPGSGPAGPWVPYGYPPARPTEGLAIAAMITSIAGVVLGFLCTLPWLACPVGAVMGHMALRRIEVSGAAGREMALAGIIVGWIGTAMILVGVVVLFLFFGIAFTGAATSGG